MADASAPDTPGFDPWQWALLAVGTAGLVRGVEVVAGGFRPAGILPVSTGVALAIAAVALWHPAVPPHVRRGGRRQLPRALLVGGLGVLAVHAGAHLLQVAAIGLAGGSPAVVLGGTNPVTGTGRFVATYVVAGVLLAALVEEVLFRGLLFETFTRDLSVRRANALQAGLFGCWHLAWPLALAVGPLEPPVSLPVLAVGTVLVTGLVGAVLGVLARSTGSLLTPIVAHAVHNGVAVFVHVRVGGLDRANVLAPALVVGYVLLAWVVRDKWG